MKNNANESVKSLYQSALDNGISNSLKSRSLLSNIAQIIEQTGIKVEFTNNEELNALGLNIGDNQLDSINVDGVIKINTKQSVE